MIRLLLLKMKVTEKNLTTYLASFAMNASGINRVSVNTKAGEPKGA